MKVTIKGYSNGYLIDTPDSRHKVKRVEWNGLPVDIEYLVINVDEVEAGGNSVNLRL